ncbi:hypothetical protein [Flavobacterium sp.]|uniref:hypothetical protein n=1 Tax=Flavobacterium sp. TaxID=239 RepID=UPI0025F62A6B|nr:hypothetical protein [Flavobacterium sp.]
MYKAKTIGVTKTSKSAKKTKLYLGIVFDLIGMCPTLFPPLGWIWAPISGLILASMYKGKTGKMAGIIDFAEELLPVVDFIPTFTLTWFYVYVINGEE